MGDARRGRQHRNAPPCGDVEAGTEVDEDWILALERRHFLALLGNAKTQERIVHTLKTGKPLRN